MSLFEEKPAKIFFFGLFVSFRIESLPKDLSDNEVSLKLSMCHFVLIRFC